MHRLHVDEWDAQERLDALIDEVQTGKIIVITREGRPVAELHPYCEALEAVNAAIKGDP